MVNIKINGKPVVVEPGKRIIEITDHLQIHIPRFCYHEKLSVVANCRMCLVEIVGAKKLSPACSTYRITKKYYGTFISKSSIRLSYLCSSW